MPVRAAAVLVLLASVPAAAQLAPIFPGKLVDLEGPNTSEIANVTLTDVDADGVMDLLMTGATLSPQTPLVNVLRGLRAGGFTAPQTSPMAGFNLVGVTVGDLDGDPWPDVAAITYNQRIVVAHGVGDGSFVQSFEYFAGNGQPVAVAIADVNQDGRGDVLSGTNTSPGWINVNLADGGGGYLATQAWTAGLKITDMTVTDLDADGRPDVLACDSTIDKLAVVRDDDAGGFLAPQLLGTPKTPRRVLAGPLDGDADVDAIVIAGDNSIPAQGLVQPWLNDGTGSLHASPTLTIGAHADAAALGDLDADGDLDLAVWCWDDQAIHLLLNDGAASFASADNLPVASGIHGLGLADATGDGVLDVLLSMQGEQVAVFPAAAPGDFETGDVWFDGSNLPYAVDVAPVDGDDWPDVVVSASSSPTLATLKATATGLQTTPVLSGGYAIEAAVRVADLDGDGLGDVVAAPTQATPLRLQYGHGFGNGAFAAPQELTWTGSLFNARELALQDLDGDGWRDVIALALASPSTLITFRNAGGAPLSFGAPQVQGVGNNAAFLAVGDLDDDGLADAVVAEPAGNYAPNPALLVLRGDPSGSLQPGLASVLPSAGQAPAGLALADMNLDGRLDAVVGLSYGGEVAVALGDGAGGFAARAWDPGQHATALIVLGDIDGDGWPDVVHGGDSTDPVLVLRLGDGSGGLLAPQTTACPSRLQELALSDFNHDGRPDLLEASWTGLSGVPNRVQTVPNIAAPFTWKDLGFGLAGETGEPRLVGTGELLPGTPGFLRLTRAQPSAPCALFVSPTATPAPFKGGTLVPLPPGLIVVTFVGADGTTTAPWNAWPSNHPGASWYFQFGVQDAGGPHGAALSNALSGTEP